ncbi:hypothetical protein ACHAXT_003317 [Thalassiosira profunda]
MTPLAKAAAAAVRARAGPTLPTGSVASFAQTASLSTSEGSDDDDHYGVWPPNQTTVIFQRMEETCPDVLTAYAQCVTNKQNGGALTQGACEEEFRAVMGCFRSVRH